MTEDDEDGGYSGGLGFFAEPDVDRVDPRELYSLLKRKPDVRDWHIAIRGVRDPSDEVRVRAYGDSGVEYQLHPDGPGAKHPYLLPDGLLVSYWRERAGEPLFIFGLIGDHVEAVHIEIGELNVRARVENNGFAARLDSSLDDFHFVLRRADGTSVEI
jgi:hypothetical protein